MAETPVRWECVRRIIDLARDHEALRGVNIQPGWPGDEVGVECIYLDHIEGDLTVPVTKDETARVNYDDTFDLTWAVRIASDGKTRDGTMARLFEIVSALHDVIATQSQLDQLDGVVAARISHGREEADDVRGMGFFGFASIVVSVHSRLV